MTILRIKRADHKTHDRECKISLMISITVFILRTQRADHEDHNERRRCKSSLGGNPSLYLCYEQKQQIKKLVTKEECLKLASGYILCLYYESKELTMKITTKGEGVTHLRGEIHHCVSTAHDQRSACWLPSFRHSRSSRG